MRLFNFFLKKKLLFLNILLTLYVATNLIGGERGLISYYEKEKKHKDLIQKEERLLKTLAEFEKKKSTVIDKLRFRLC